MKTFKLLIFLALIICLLGCNKSEIDEINNPEVEKYIELLKSNKYNSSNLPAFSYTDIPSLLKYRSETQTITDFPHNGISSLYAPDCTLGMYVLWTIESIRAVSINSDNLIMRFPSQNPILASRASVELELVTDSVSQTVAAKAYFDWWDNNKTKDYNGFKNIDPLENTEYKWH